MKTIIIVATIYVAAILVALGVLGSCASKCIELEQTGILKCELKGKTCYLKPNGETIYCIEREL